MEKTTFTGHTKIFMLISAAIIVVALIMSLFGAGLNMGIDFTGGVLLKYEVGTDFDVNTVEAALKEQGIAESQISKVGDGDVKTGLQIRFKDQGENTDDLRASFETKLKETYPDLAFVNIDRVGATAGRDLVANAVYSVLIVAACLLIYIGIRFDFVSGLAAIICLLHDVLIMVSFMVFAHSLYQVNSSFIAAMLTIIGYSINNTIVVFDRIRENRKLAEFHGKKLKPVVEKSVRETLSRTINTTLTTLFTLVTVYVLGVSAIKEFTFPLLVGMLAGTYSSVLLSGQIWAMLEDSGVFGRLFKKKAKA
jgi:preprotein translocase subunit SecF